MRFGEMVRERRKQLRLGLREFAQRAGMDPGNLSKIERGRLGAPQSEEILDRICEALEWRLGSDAANALKDQAAIENGQIPAAVLQDEVVMAKVPLLLRTLQNRKLEPEQIDRLIDLIRKA
jgi:transcriptional regulator with XRE-family HTH domain